MKTRDVEEVAAGQAHRAGRFREPQCSKCGEVLGFGYSITPHKCQNVKPKTSPSQETKNADTTTD